MSESVTKDAEQAAAEDLLWRVHRNGVERLNAQMLQPANASSGDPWYRPLADVGNLCIPLLDAALNHLHSVQFQFSDQEQMVQELESFRSELAACMNEHAHTKSELSFTIEAQRTLSNLEMRNPKLFHLLTRVFMLNVLLAYSMSVRGKLRNEPDLAMGEQLFNVFAFADVISDFNEDTQRAIKRDLRGKELWGWVNDAD